MNKTWYDKSYEYFQETQNFSLPESLKLNEE